MHKRYLVTAAFLGALSVAMGAFGAHMLKKMLSQQLLNTYETAVRYQFYHVFALAVTGILFKTYPNKQLRSAGLFFILGIIFFSGSLYLLTAFSAMGVTNMGWIGAITPLGGLLFITGWCLLGAGVWKGQNA